MVEGVIMEQFSLLKYHLNRKRKIITRIGESARIICHNLKGNRPIVAVIDEGGSNQIINYTKDGRCILRDIESPNDLFFAPRKRVGWINIYLSDTPYTDGNIYSSKEEAKESIYDSSGLLRNDYNGTIKIKWNY